MVLRLVFVLFSLVFQGVSALAACTSPAGEAGAREYFTSNNTYRLCDGTNWVTFADSGNAGACSTAGQLEYDTTIKGYKYCNGSTWKVAMDGGYCPISTSQISYVTAATQATNLGTAEVIVKSPDGTKAYVIGRYNNRLAVLDLTTAPAAPTILGVTSSISWLSDTTDAVLSGDHVFAVARGNQNVVVVNVSNPAAPVYVTRLTASGNQMANVWKLALSSDGTHVFAVSWGSGSPIKCYVHAVNISNPSSLSLSSSFNYTDASGSGGYVYCNAITVYNQTAFLGQDTGGIAALDVSNPASISIRSRAVGTNTANSEGIIVSRDGNYVYTTNYNATARFHTWNVSNLSAISYVGSFQNTSLFNGGYDLITAGNYVFGTGNTSESFFAVNVSNPASPVLADGLVSAANLASPGGIIVNGRYAYVTGYSGNKVSLFDLGCAPIQTDPSLGSCTGAGKIDYFSTEKVLAYCPGDRWQTIAK